jgi:hypothetical protein
MTRVKPAVLSVAVVWVAQAAGPPGCVAINANDWTYVPFGLEQIATTFTAELIVTPWTANGDIIVGVAKERTSSFDKISVTARFGVSGHIEAYSGAGYLNSPVSYQAGQPYRLRYLVDIPNHVFTLYAAAVGQQEQLVAAKVAFRSKAGSPMTLGTWVLTSDAGTAQACAFAAPSLLAPGGPAWMNTSFLPQDGLLTYEWDATPLLKAVDTVMALSQDAGTDFPQFACLVRFGSDSGMIQARNGTTYAPSSLAYNAGTTYHFRVVANVRAHAYSVYVTPEGGTEQTVGTNLSFRDGQTTIAALNNFGVRTDVPTNSSGGTRVANFRLTQLQDTFTGPQALITSEYATNNPSPYLSAFWIVSSGALYRDQNTGHASDSEFRAHGSSNIDGNYRVSFALRSNRVAEHNACNQCWNGVHVFLRHLSQFDLYYVSVNRADNTAVIKRKVPCAPDSNDGKYIELSPYKPYRWSEGIWQHLSATVQTNANDTVTIRLFNDDTGAMIVEGVDAGGFNDTWSRTCTAGRYPSAQYPPILSGGATGIRSDNADINIDNFTVTRF